jgi:hypothetical protein
MPILVSEKQKFFARLAIFYRFAEGTFPCTESLPCAIDMAEKIILATPSDSFFRRKSRQFRCTSIPVGDSPVCIHKVDSVVQTVEQASEEIGILLSNV